jgi:outer membrane protein assembly factor BamB
MRKDIQRLGRTSPRGLGWIGLLVLIGIAVLAGGCASVANPEGWAPPTLVDDTLYVSIEPGKMAALDPEDLSVKWVFPPDTDEGNKLDLEGIYAAPVLVDETVYFGAYDGNIYALNASDGTALWRFETGDPVTGALALKDGTLYAGSTDGLLYALDIASCTNGCPPGDQVPSFDTGSSIWASPLLAGDVIYVPAMDGRLHALNAATLEPVDRFSFKAGAGLVMDPTLAGDDTLLVGGIDSTLQALNPATGDEKWSFKAGNWFWGTPLVSDDAVYIADLDGNVYAIGLTDGKQLWASPFKVEAAVRSAPLLAGDTLVIVGRDGKAYGLNPDDGTRQWGPTLLGKSVLSNPILLERTISPSVTTGPSPSPAAGSPSPTPGASPSGMAVGETVVLIVAQGGDLCTIDPADGSPAGALLCAEVPL